MKSKLLTRAELLALLQRQITEAGGVRRWACAHQVNPGTVSKAARGGAELTSAQVMKGMGVEVVYREFER